jgi:RNA polymerase sigma-70 factor (ECF subfamily)
MININTEKIERAKQGDKEIIAALYEHNYLSVFRYLYYRVGNRQLAEDLTSEVFERMLRFIGGFHPPSDSFKAWLFQIARNLSTDHFRKMNIRPATTSLEENIADNSANPGSELERTLDSERLLHSLSGLTEDQRDVILMRFIAGMPIAETAQALQKSEDAVKGLQRRALITLKTLLSS